MGVSREVCELKAALKDFVNLTQDIRNQTERYNEMIAGLGTVGAPELKLVPNGPPKPGDKIGAILVRVEKIRTELETMEARRYEFEDRLETVLGRLSKPDEKNVIRLRYIDCKSWREITIRIYSGRGVKVTSDNAEACEHVTQSIHGAALAHIVEVCEEYPELKFWGTPTE